MEITIKIPEILEREARDLHRIIGNGPDSKEEAMRLGLREDSMRFKLAQLAKGALMRQVGVQHGN